MSALEIAPPRSLDSCELEIERGVSAAGEALEEIRRNRLYKQSDYPSFDAYCRDRWGWSRSQADRVIAAHTVMQENAATFAAVRGVDDKKTPIGVKESHARELRRVPKEQRREVVARASEKTSGKITAKALREAWEDAPPLTVVDLETGEIVEVSDEEDTEWIEAEGTRTRLEQCMVDIRFRLRDETVGVSTNHDRERSDRAWRRCAELLAELAALLARRCPDAVRAALAPE